MKQSHHPLVSGLGSDEPAVSADASTGSGPEASATSGLRTPSPYWQEVPVHGCISFDGLTRRKWRLAAPVNGHPDIAAGPDRGGYIAAEVTERHGGGVSWQTDQDWSRQTAARHVRDAMLAAESATQARISREGQASADVIATSIRPGKSL